MSQNKYSYTMFANSFKINAILILPLISMGYSPHLHRVIHNFKLSLPLFVNNPPTFWA